ncbi:hypothetical protein CM19_11675 [Candidatus Acidianus copahuensis]|uniref:NurA domain-containing protein n=1 Tax=Candidatus Acidianus copahuensis TaxID=1160895 RepID=A0A031LK89_9CREN|nr:hypothetical protein CM19_11675 [Candidatus Acidianus copahuensis]
MSERGVSITFIKLLKLDKYPFDRIVAIDGSLHEVVTDEGKVSIVVAVGVIFSLTNMRMISNIVKETIVEGEGEEVMRNMEYNLANELGTDLVLMDRKISMDVRLGIPNRVIGIVKDFEQKKRASLNSYPPPWIGIEEKDGEIVRGYFNFLRWTFMFETNVDDLQLVSSLLYSLSEEPIPESLGYNYPLFLADKLAKYYRDRRSKGMDYIWKNIKYRDFRSMIENGRKFL